MKKSTKFCNYGHKTIESFISHFVNASCYRRAYDPQVNHVRKVLCYSSLSSINGKDRVFDCNIKSETNKRTSFDDMQEFIFDNYRHMVNELKEMQLKYALPSLKIEADSFNRMIYIHVVSKEDYLRNLYNLIKNKEIKLLKSSFISKLKFSRIKLESYDEAFGNHFKNEEVEKKYGISETNWQFDSKKIQSILYSNRNCGYDLKFGMDSSNQIKISLQNAEGFDKINREFNELFSIKNEIFNFDLLAFYDIESNYQEQTIEIRLKDKFDKEHLFDIFDKALKIEKARKDKIVHLSSFRGICS